MADNINIPSDDPAGGDPAPTVHEFVSEEADAGTRLDAWLGSKFPELSRNRLQGLIREGAVIVAGKPRSPGYKMRAGQAARIGIPPEQPENSRDGNSARRSSAFSNAMPVRTIRKRTIRI